MRAGFACFLWLASMLAGLAVTPTITRDLDVNAVTQQQALTFLQASTPRVEFRILQGGQPLKGLTGYTGSLKYGTTLSPTAGWVSVDSSNTDAVNSRIRFDFDQADTNTNGTFKAVVQLLDGSGGLFYSGTVSLSILASTANTGADTLDLGTTVDWAGTTYSNGLTAGPYSAGTNINFTAGSGGKVVVNSKVVGTAAAGRVLYGDADGTWKALAAGTSGQVLTSAGAAAPSWSNAGAGDIGSVVAGTGLSGGGTSGDVTLSIAEGDKGDLTISSGVWTIDAGAVTLAKQANLAQATVIGRASGAGTGTPTALTASQLATIVQGASVFLPLTGGTLSGDLFVEKALPNIQVSSTSTDPLEFATLSMMRSVTPGSYPAEVGRLDFYDDSIPSFVGRISVTTVGGTGGGQMVLSTADPSAAEPDAAITITSAQNVTLGGTITGNGSGLTNLDATDLTGDIPAASFGALEIEATDRDFHLYTVEDVGWALAYTATNAFDCVKTGNSSSEQDGILQSDLMRTPRGFVAYATTGALVIEWIADNTTLADIRGIRLLGYSTPNSTPVAVYSDSTTRNVTSAASASAVNSASISINAASLTTSTVYAYYRIEVTVALQAVNSTTPVCLAIVNSRVVSQ